MKIASFKLQISKILKSFFVNFNFAILILQFIILIAGCASPKGPLVLSPLPTQLPGYAVAEKKIFFINSDLKIGISHINPSETKKILASQGADNPLAEMLTEPQYFAFLLDIENSSKEKVIYNPVLTTLFDSEMGVHKPLDYTDLYALMGDSPNRETAINNLKDAIYDLAVTIPPNKRSSRLLIFSGIEKEAGEVSITMKEIYVGTKATAVSFGFKISP